jgi:hypothetical protein
MGLRYDRARQQILARLDTVPRHPCLMYLFRPLLILGLIGYVAAVTFAASPDSAPKMKAIVVHAYGGPEVLKYEDVPRPEPKADQMLVKVIAAAVNPVDGMIRSGKFANYFHTTLPLTPGYDIAGIVEKTGPKITKFNRAMLFTLISV